ncbi:MAG: hypothetical protein WCQ57_01935, partial [Verrucomicrobiota bacterium]
PPTLAPIATLRVTTGGILQSDNASIGNTGEGSLHLDQGAKFQIGQQTNVGVAPQSQGVLWLDGENTSMQPSETKTPAVVTVGLNGEGHLKLSSGATATARILNIGRSSEETVSSLSSDSTGLVEASGSTSILRVGELYIGGGKRRKIDPAFADGTGKLIVAQGAVVETGQLHVYPKGSVEIGESHIEVTGTYDEETLPVETVFEAGSKLVLTLYPSMKKPALTAKDLTISGANLELQIAEGFKPAPGTTLPLVSFEFRDTDQQFEGKAEGDVLDLGSFGLRINYGRDQITGTVVARPQK